MPLCEPPLAPPSGITPPAFVSGAPNVRFIARTPIASGNCAATTIPSGLFRTRHHQSVVVASIAEYSCASASNTNDPDAAAPSSKVTPDST